MQLICVNEIRNKNDTTMPNLFMPMIYLCPNLSKNRFGIVVSFLFLISKTNQIPKFCLASRSVPENFVQIFLQHFLEIIRRRLFHKGCKIDVLLFEHLDGVRKDFDCRSHHRLSVFRPQKTCFSRGTSFHTGEQKREAVGEERRVVCMIEIETQRGLSLLDSC
jgi:hypothetical protein